VAIFAKGAHFSFLSTDVRKLREQLFSLTIAAAQTGEKSRECYGWFKN